MKSVLLVALTVLLTAPFQVESKSVPKRPEVGKPAPTLRLNDHSGKIVQLGSKRENWTVLAFFPKAATPG